MKTTVIEWVGSMAEGGAEMLIRDYALGLRDRGYDVVVVSVHADKSSVCVPLLQDNGIRVIPIYRCWNLPVRCLNKIMGSYIVSRRLKRILREVRPSCLHAHLAVLRYLLPIRKELRSEKLLYTCHSAPELYFSGRNRGEKCAARLLIRDNGLHLIALHQAMKENLQTLFPGSEVSVVRNGVDFDRFRCAEETKEAVRDRLNIPRNAFVIGHIGRFCPEKNHEFLIDIFAVAHKKNPDAFLLLVGSGNGRNPIEKRLTESGMQGSFLILSHRSDVPAILKAMDVFVLPSLFEGLPLTLVEAQAAGLPCVVSDRVTEEAIFSDRTVSLSLAGSAEEWTNAIICPDRFEPHHADAADFSLDHELDELEMLYQRSLL